MRVELKRVYEDADSRDGYRALVDRVWPRGISKDRAAVDAWWKDIAPSNQLRKAFGHDADKWGMFCERYAAELEANREAIDAAICAVEGDLLTLVYGARDTQHNQAVALRNWLEANVL